LQTKLFLYDRWKMICCIPRNYPQKSCRQSASKRYRYRNKATNNGKIVPLCAPATSHPSNNMTISINSDPEHACQDHPQTSGSSSLSATIGKHSVAANAKWSIRI
jgi:hypothetical protein